MGAAAESIVIEIRDALAEKLQAVGASIPRELSDWRVKQILIAIEAVIGAQKGNIPKSLFDRFQAHWPAFTHRIRTARNDAGHPVSVDPVTADEVHASLLIFPQLASLASELKSWIDKSYSTVVGEKVI